MMYILLATFTLEGASIQWDEFAGCFDSIEAAQSKFTPEDYSWMQDMHGTWFTEDLAAGSGLRRSYRLLEVEMNTVILKIGELRLNRLK